jgi:hypothetical protein
VKADVLGGIQDGALDVEGAGFRIAPTENKDQILAAQRLRHEFPSLSGSGVAGEACFHQRRRVEFGFHGFHQIFSGVLRAAQACLFFFDFADLAVNLVARRFEKGIEKFLEAFGLAEFAGEKRMDGHEAIDVTEIDGRLPRNRSACNCACDLRHHSLAQSSCLVELTRTCV